MAEIKAFSVRDEVTIRGIQFAVEYRLEHGETHLNLLMPGNAHVGSLWPNLPLQRAAINRYIEDILSRRPKFQGKDFVVELVAEVWVWLQEISNHTYYMTPNFIPNDEE